MKVIYNFVNMYIGNITINIHDNVCQDNAKSNFVPFVWNDPLVHELEKRLSQSEQEKKQLIDALSQKDVNHKSNSL